jgi:Zn-dependent alcohol dehydrogenase
MDVASLLACGVTTGFGAVVNRAKVPPMSSVVVIGTGGVGLNAVQGAVICGANPIIAVDMLDSKVGRAREFGATHGVNASAADPTAAVRELTGGRGADYVFVTVGSSAAMQQAWSMLVRGGTAVMVGMPPATDPPISIPAGELAFTEKTLTGGFMGSIRLQADIPALIALYRAGRYKLDELITGRYPFERINEAIGSSAAGEAIRNVLIFG